MNIKTGLFPALFLGTALFLLLDTSVWAQGGGGGRGGRRRANWEEDFERAKNKAAKDERFLLLYLHDPEEDDPPTIFNVEELRAASRNDWVFSREPFEFDNPLREEYGVKRAPTILGMDEYGNEFDRVTRVTSTEIRRLLKNVETRVALFKKRIQSEYSKGKSAVRQNNNSKALESFSKILKMRKDGYPEVEKADAWVVDYARKELERLRGISGLTEQLKVGNALAKKCEGSSIEGRIQIELALLEQDAGQVRAALRRLGDAEKKLRGSQKAEVRSEREALIAFGMKKIDALVALTTVGKKEKAKEGLKMVRDDYKGTEVAAEASEALKDIR